MDTKSLDRRSIRNVGGTPRAKVAWADLPANIQISLEKMLNPERGLKAVTEKKPGKGPRVFSINYNRPDWASHLYLGVQHGSKAGFFHNSNQLVFDVILKDSCGETVPSELWLIDKHRSSSILGTVYQFDKKPYEDIRAYARKLRAEKVA